MLGLKSSKRDQSQEAFHAPFPELEKPQSDYRYGRKMFAVHKNMHSAGYLIGTDSVTQRYREAVYKALNERIAPMKPLVIEDEESVDHVSDEVKKLKEQLKEKEKELERVKAAIQSLPALEQSKSSSPSRRTSRNHVSAQELYQLSKSMDRSDSPVVRQAYSVRKPMNRDIPPFASVVFTSKRKDSFLVHELAKLPVFFVPKFTKKRPKVNVFNPITGFRNDLSVRRSPAPYYSRDPFGMR